MSALVDTSTAAVKQVCAAFQVVLDRYQPGAIERELFTSTIEKLRALAAERDAAMSRSDTAMAMMTARGTNRDYWQAKAEAVEVERDAALAEAARLRDALEAMVVQWLKFARYGSPIAQQGNEALHKARAALAAAP